MKAKNSDGWPKIFKWGGVSVKVYRIADGGSWDYYVCWYFGGTRRRKKFAHEDKALAFAKEQLWFIGEGKMSVAGKGVDRLSDSDRDMFKAAVKLLKPVGISLITAVTDYVAAVNSLKPVGGGLITAITDYVSAAKVMGERGSLTLAANDFVNRAAPVEKYTPTSEVVEELLAIMEKELKIKPKRRRDVQTMRSHLRQFAKATKIPIQEITLDTAVSWLQGSTATDRSFNNKRTSLVRLGSFCKQKCYLPNDRPTPFELIRPKRNVGEHEVHALPPHALRVLLDAAIAAQNHEAALYFAIGFFTGMRTSELQRLQWNFFYSERDTIILPAKVTKNNRKRTVPIQPVLKAWLDLLAPKRSGKVFSSDKTTVRCIDFARPLMPAKRGTGEEEPDADWWENCMRDSYASYRAITTYSVGQVALEIGNSEPMVRRCYFDVTADEQDAKIWFEIGPEGWVPSAPAA